MEILRVENLTFTYPLCEHPAVNDLSFSLESGDFTVLCGATGSGKSTLLKLLKREIAPNGDESGEILFRGRSICEIDSTRIGFVMQHPDEQIVTDKVYSELAFILENSGLEQSVIARRVAEMASYFGIEDWYERDVSTLSGGQKQLLNLASVMVANPDILILDEPTSQLDPIATSDFIATLKKLNRDLSLTVIIAEHRLEELIPICDRMIVMDKGNLIKNGSPREIIAELEKDSALISLVPSGARLYHMLSAKGICPLTVREGRNFIESRYNNVTRSLAKTEYSHSAKSALEFKDVYFRYERHLPDVLKGLSFTVYENEIFCILGGNGSGKTTSLSCAAGIRKVYSGKIKIFGKKISDYSGQTLYQNCLTLLPQDVQSLFLRNTVREELIDAKADVSKLPFDLSHLLDKHPYDLSGGEQQLLALAKVLATNPRIILMDEPTKGLDANKKNTLIKIVHTLKASGVTVVIVTHDVEFAALCSDRSALFFRGDIVSVGTPREFFSENNFYTTAASRMSKGYFDNAVTVEDIAELCRINGEREKERSL
ncbi:MAG: energy-coupling factor ABC transporter ATP-binding protein [Clostridia bacterium]|nr:energy-coupling factor ABC transporter ATP-binding protein [Clostridia bacterium]